MFPGLVEALLVAPTKSSPLLEPHYAAPSEFSHLRECRKQWLWQLTLLESLARSQNAVLLRPGDVEKNPGPVATGNADSIEEEQVPDRDPCERA